MVYTTQNDSAESPFFLICDHATNRFPPGFGDPGLSKEALNSHIALDIGAADVTSALSDDLGCPAIFHDFSRLIVDVNRDSADNSFIVTEGEGTPVPGNMHLTPADRDERIRAYYTPYHNAIDARLDRIAARRTPLVVSVHSFTPQFYNQKRPWHIGFLWTHDNRVAGFLRDYFEARGYTVGDNQPYDARMVPGTTINRHADVRRLPNVLIELRNDLIDTEDKARDWAGMLAAAFREMEALPEIFTLYEDEQVQCSLEASRRYFENVVAAAKKGKV